MRKVDFMLKVYILVTFFNVLVDDITKIKGMSYSHLIEKYKINKKDFLQKVEDLKEVFYKIKFVSWRDDLYPKKLLEYKDAPLFLFYQGQLELLSNERIICAVIGSRGPSKEGIQLCKDYVRNLKNTVVLSGGAYGIDTIAMETALNANIPVIGVLASPLDKPYPMANSELFDKIVKKNGLLLSITLDGQQFSKYDFIRRDWIQTLLSNRVAAVDFGNKTLPGTRHAANAAIDYRIPLEVGCGLMSKEFIAKGGLPMMVPNKNQTQTQTSEFKLSNLFTCKYHYFLTEVDGETYVYSSSAEKIKEYNDNIVSVLSKAIMVDGITLVVPNKIQNKLLMANLLSVIKSVKAGKEVKGSYAEFGKAVKKSKAKVCLQTYDNFGCQAIAAGNGDKLVAEKEAAINTLRAYIKSAQKAEKEAAE